MKKVFDLIEREPVLKIEFENEEIRDKITFELQEKFDAKIKEELGLKEVKTVLEFVFLTWTLLEKAKRYLKKRQKEEKFKYKIIET